MRLHRAHDDLGAESGQVVATDHRIQGLVRGGPERAGLRLVCEQPLGAGERLARPAHLGHEARALEPLPLSFLTGGTEVRERGVGIEAAIPQVGLVPCAQAEMPVAPPLPDVYLDRL